jgi:putative ABC transport system permease protein
MTLLRIAFRNVLKNRRRSLITMLAIGFGFMAVAMFHGYNHYSYRYLKEGSIRGSGLGHYCIFRKGFNLEGRIDPTNYFLSGGDLKKISAILDADPLVALAMPQMNLNGLFSNGKTTTIFLADALVPGLDRRLLGEYSLQGTDVLSTNKPYGVLVGSGMFDLFKLKRGDSVVLMATTISGQMNALDAEVVGTYDTTSDALNDKYVRVPFTLAQNLLDTDGATRVSVLLKDDTLLDDQISHTKNALTALGVDVEIKRWNELSQFYTKVKDYLDAMFVFVNTIVFLIVILSVVNTISMSVMERVREIGTLRAMGLKPRAVLAMFAWEGATLGLAGSVVGAALTLLGSYVVSIARITYQAPGLAYEGLLLVDIVPPALLVFAIGFTVLTSLSSAFAARRGSGVNIVEALGHT